MSSKESPNKAKPVAQDSTGSNGLVNIVLLAAIVVVVLASQHIKDSLGAWKLSIETLSAPLSAEPMKLDRPGSNPMCPSAVEDYESCMEKLTRCKDTEKEFQKAEQCTIFFNN